VLIWGVNLINKNYVFGKSKNIQIINVKKIAAKKM
jgi:hypothetical protein